MYTISFKQEENVSSEICRKQMTNSSLGPNAYITQYHYYSFFTILLTLKGPVTTAPDNFMEFFFFFKGKRLPYRFIWLKCWNVIFSTCIDNQWKKLITSDKKIAHAFNISKILTLWGLQAGVPELCTCIKS